MFWLNIVTDLANLHKISFNDISKILSFFQISNWQLGYYFKNNINLYILLHRLFYYLFFLKQILTTKLVLDVHQLKLIMNAVKKTIQNMISFKLLFIHSFTVSLSFFVFIYFTFFWLLSLFLIFFFSDFNSMFLYSS